MDSHTSFDIITLILMTAIAGFGVYFLRVGPNLIAERPGLSDAERHRYVRLFRIFGVIMILCGLVVIGITLAIDFGAFD